jgi:hypothetical protein
MNPLMIPMKEPAAAQAPAPGSAANATKSDEGSKSSGSASSKTSSVPAKASPQKAADAEGSESNDGQDDGAKLSKGGAIGFCRSATYALTFSSTKALPFAVRLVELELKNGIVRVKAGNYKAPGSLGASAAEKMTAQLQGDPILSGLQYRPHPKKGG